MSETEAQGSPEPAGTPADDGSSTQSETGVGLGAGEPNTFEPEEPEPAEDDPPS